MTPILLALAYTAMDQGEWWMGLGVALLAVVGQIGKKECMMDDLRSDLDWLFEEFRDNANSVASDRCVETSEFDEVYSDVERAYLIIDRVKKLLPGPVAS